MKPERPLKCFQKEFKMKKGLCISSIRFDHGGELENHVFGSFCNEHDISHNLSSLRTPQQNRVAEQIFARNCQNHAFRKWFIKRFFG